MAVVSMKKRLRRPRQGDVWGVVFPRQFMYTKFVIVTDDDVNA